jgi:hypothetical protein
MYHQQGVDNMSLIRTGGIESELIPHASSGSCCAICQKTANDYYQHWACSKFFAICQHCYSDLRMIQCANCKGVGTSADIITNKKISLHIRYCPACQERLLGSGQLRLAAAV